MLPLIFTGLSGWYLYRSDKLDLHSKCILRLLIKDSHSHLRSIYLKSGNNKPTKPGPEY